MISANKIDKLILSELIKANRRLDSFTLFKRTKISFGSFSQSLHTLEKNQVVEIKDLVVTLSLKGMEFSSKLNLLEKKRPQKIQLQPQFACNQISKDEFYIPTIKRLDKKTFPIKDSLV